MKEIAFFVLVFLTAATAYTQGVRPDQRPEITAPVASDDLYTQARGTLQRIRLDTLRRFLGVDIDQTQRSYNPVDSVAAADRYKIIQGADNQWYYIDRDKNYLQLTSAATAPQVLSIDSSGTSFTVSLSGSGGSVTFKDDVNDADASPTNELQTISIDSSANSFTITLSNSGGSVSFTDSDGVSDADYGDITVTSGIWTLDSNVVGNDELAPSAVTTLEILDLTITAADLAANAVTSAKIAADAVGDSQLASTAVAAGTYTAADITVDADGRLTAAASGTIDIAELSTAAQDSITIGRRRVFDVAPTSGAQTIALNNKTVGIFQIDCTSASSPLTLTVNNPVDGGVYTFHFRNTTTNDVAFPANFYNADGTSLGTVTYTADDFLTCYYDGTNFYCK